MKISQLLDYTREILQPERFRDYCPEDLAVLGLRLVAVPSPDALEEPENVVG